MTTTAIDEQTAIEDERLIKRAETRKRVQEAAEHWAALSQAQRNIDLANQQKDAAARDCEARCLSMRAEATTAKQKAELDAKIQGVYEALEDTLKKLNAAIRLNADRISQLQSVRVEPADVVKTRLTREPLVNHKLWVAHFVAQQSLEWARQRLEVAAAKAGKWDSLLRAEQSRREGRSGERRNHLGQWWTHTEPITGEEQTLQARFDKWNAEANAARKAFTSAQAEERRAWQEMIDE